MGSKVKNGNASLPARRSPGRPRSERAQQAILNATLDFFEPKENGFADLTIEHVAATAGVGKATVYRWWSSKAALVADAFASNVHTKLHFPNTGSVKRDMCLQMQQLVKVLRSRRGHIVSAMIGAGQSDMVLLAAFRDRFLKPRRAEAFDTLRRGIERGELPGDLDFEHVLDSLYGPIYMRFLLRHQSLTPQFVDQLCNAVFCGNMPRKSGAGRTSAK